MRPETIFGAGFYGLLFARSCSCADAPPSPRGASGSLSLLDNKPQLTFQYSTPDPDKDNWVGLYLASGGGPDDQKYVESSLEWDYAPDENGTVHLDTSDLQPGSYRAFFLAKGGYEWLAGPIAFYFRQPGPVSFVVSDATLQNARLGEPFAANVNGFLLGGGHSSITFSKVPSAGSEWATVSSNGTIHGTPGPSDMTTRIAIKAAASDGSNDSLNITIPVRPSGESLVDKLSVMTYNLWHGGTQVEDYHKKQLKFLISSGADVVGFQETTGGHAARLGEALGWYAWQGQDAGIISRYPIVEKQVHKTYGGFVRIALGEKEKSELILWNVHLGYDPYGPYDFCFDNKSLDQVLEDEAKSNRTSQIIDVVAAMKDHLGSSQDAPVLLVGDFNAPSHLDWVESTKDQHCGQADVPWPSSKHPVDAGLVDSFRALYPDPAAKPGISWSPIYLENEGRPEPLDRIDFIYHKGSLSVLESETVLVGHPTPEPDHKQNEWTSDHRAFRTIYKLVPK